MQSKYMHCLKLTSYGTWKHKSKVKELPFGGCADFRGNELWFLQIWVSLLRKQEGKTTARATLWHDTRSSGQIDQFNFASHVSKLSNAGWLLPDTDVHSTVVYHPKKYPGAAWASFLPTSSFPPAVPGGMWHQANLPFPRLLTKSLFFNYYYYSHSFAQSCRRVSTESHVHPLYRREGFLFIQGNCNTYFQLAAKETNAEKTSTSQITKPTEAEGMALHPLLPPIKTLCILSMPQRIL